MSLFHEKQDGKIFPELHESPPDNSKPAEYASERGNNHVSAGRADWDDEPIRPSPRVNFRNADLPREQRGTGGLWLALAFLLALLAGAAFYGKQTLEDANIQVSKVPAMLRSLASVDTRLGGVESQLKAWSQNLQDVSGRLNKVEQNARVEYAKARKHAEALTAQVKDQVGQLQKQIADRDRAVDARLDSLDGTQKSAQERIAQLQQQLSDARQELASLQQETNGDLATLHQRVAGNNEQLGRLTNEVERHRLNFELSKNQITNLSSEVTMNLTSTNVSYQQFSGWVYYEPDHRYMWIHEHGVMQPVVFYDTQKSRQYEVVVTAIRPDSAVGYLLMPQGSSVVQPEPSAGAVAGGK